MVGWFIALWRFLHGDVSSTVLKTWKTRETETRFSQNFEILYPIQGTTRWKLTSWGFRKCGSFWVWQFSNGSYWLSKSSHIPRKFYKAKIYSAIYTDHQVQFSNGFAIFHKPQGTQGLWKIAKNHNPLAKFCSVNGRIFIYFFHFFQKKISNLSKK